MDERDRERTDPSPDAARWSDEEIGALLERAGARPRLAAEDVRVLTDAARSAWRARHAEEPGQDSLGAAGGRGRRSWWAVAGLAAALVLAVGVAVSVGWWWRARGAGVEPATVASVETIAGAVTILDADGRAREARKDQPLVAGLAVASGDGRDGAPGRTLLRLADGASVRLDRGSLVRFVSASVLALERGAVYVDSEPVLGADRRDRQVRTDRAIEVRTALGTARDVGTRFAVRLVEESERAGPRQVRVRVRVRSGAVVVERSGRSRRAVAGQELTVGPRDAALRDVEVYGPEWQWVLDTAPEA